MTAGISIAIHSACVDVHKLHTYTGAFIGMDLERKEPMALAKVLARGQITLAREVRRSAGIRPGDLVTCSVSGPGRVELHVLPRLTLAEALERYHIDEPIDWDRWEDWKDVAARDVFGES
jgi:bifunctional DNA-binding transcriptional regulator/antitoxin component of YhaV-PrlF toxin-antitoxin module